MSKNVQKFIKMDKFWSFFSQNLSLKIFPFTLFLGQMPLQQQQNIGTDTHQSQQSAQNSSSDTGPEAVSAGQPNGTREPPPPAPQPSGGMKLPPPTLQITLHDENNQQQSLMGGGVRTDLSPVSEEDLVSLIHCNFVEFHQIL